MKNKNKQTKFPVARIKKIMQKDEEVGKVAQATPIVISKALELFLSLIVEESHKVTAERGSKKVEAYHLKHAVNTTEMLDFLKEIVEGVPDPSNGGTVNLEEEATEKKKKTKGKRGAAGTGEPGAKRRRRKKGDAVKEEMDTTEGGGEGEGNTDQDMQEDDDEEDTPYNAGINHRVPEGGYRPRSPSDEDEDEKPYIPGR